MTTASLLDDATLATAVRTTLEALPVSPTASRGDITAQREAAAIALVAFRPRDPLEAMLAARIIAAHSAAMELHRRAMRPEIDDNAAQRLSGRAAAMANLASRTERELKRCQAAPPAYPIPESLLPAAAPPPVEPVIATQTPPDAAPETPASLPSPGPVPHIATNTPPPHPAVRAPAAPVEAMRNTSNDGATAQGHQPAAVPARDTRALAA